MKKLLLLSLLFSLFPSFAWANSIVPQEILVQYEAKTSRSEKKEAKRDLGARVLKSYSNLPRIELLEVDSVKSALSEAKASPDIKLASPNLIRNLTEVPNDPFYSKQWGLENTGQEIVVGSSSFFGTPGADIAGPLAWNTRTDASSVPLAIIDSGIDLSHPDLEDNLWTNPGEIAGNGIDDDENGYIDDIHGWDFINNDNNPTDDNGHGTHVAGIAGAKGDNSLGVAGVAWEASLAALKACNALSKCPVSATLEALNYALENNISLSNNSYGGIGEIPIERAAIGAARDQGHLFVASAGNDTQDNAGPSASYPASYDLDNVISVAASTMTDSQASYSNYGGNTALAAPGSTVYSTTVGGSYDYKSGTSMAAPYVAGAAALLRSKNPSDSYLEIRSALLETRAVPAFSTNTLSGGVLNLEKALSYVSKPTIVSFPNPSRKNVQIAFSSSLATECKLNEEPYQDCSSPKNYTLPLEGDYTFSVRAKSGDQYSEVADYSWKALEVAFLEPSYSFSSGVFTFSGAPAGYTYLCGFSESLGPCSSPFYPLLSNGQYPLFLAIEDPEGNRSETIEDAVSISGAPRPAAGVVGIVAPSFTNSTKVDLSIIWPTGTREIEIAGKRYFPSKNMAYFIEPFASFSRINLLVRYLGAGSREILGSRWSVTYDSLPPQITRATIQKGKRFFLSLGASDKSGISKAEIRFASGKRSFAYKTRYSFSTRPQSIRVLDRAKNWSAWKKIKASR